MKENPNVYHRSRLKRRFLNTGLTAFEPHNILELLLFYAIPRADTNKIAHALINKFGSLHAVFDADVKELMTIDGIRLHTATLLKLIPEISTAYRTDKIRSDMKFGSIESIGAFLCEYYSHINYEAVTLLLFDNKTALIDFVKIFEGSINSSDINARKIAEMALIKGASEIILAHNHPLGEAVPSASDIKTTGYLKNALEGIDIHLIEHIVVAGEDYTPIIEYVRNNPNLSSLYYGRY